MGWIPYMILRMTAEVKRRNSTLKRRGCATYTLLVTIQLKPQHREAFIQEMLADARSALEAEPGVVQFDMHQAEDDPNRFYMYEVFRDEAAFQAHLQTPHVDRLREMTKEWYAAPSVIRRGVNIFPTDDSWE